MLNHLETCRRLTAESVVGYIESGLTLTHLPTAVRHKWQTHLEAKLLNHTVNGMLDVFLHRCVLLIPNKPLVLNDLHSMHVYMSQLFAMSVHSQSCSFEHSDIQAEV